MESFKQVAVESVKRLSNEQLLTILDNLINIISMHPDSPKLAKYIDYKLVCEKEFRIRYNLDRVGTF